MNLLEELLRDNQAQGKKIALLETQLTEERSAIKVRLAQDKASADRREKSLYARSVQLEEEVRRLSRELGEVKLDLSKARADLSASEAVRRQLESEVLDLNVQYKDYEKKIMDA